MSALYELFTRIILLCISKTLDDAELVEQAGFRQSQVIQNIPGILSACCPELFGLTKSF